MVNRIAPRIITVAIHIALSAYAGSAFAQSAASGVEEVTVTARKRAESSQSVDISMSVITADEISKLRLRNLPEVAAYAQNVAMFEDFPGAGIPTWFIRGVGLQDFNSNNTPTAGVYVDGNYQVATVMGMTALYDVSQVEILKGPQGGLYGRNTSGGAVLVNSNRAVIGQREGNVQLSYGSWDQAIAEGMINIPLGESVAWRVAGRVENSSGGWQKSIGSNDEHGEKDRWDLRSWMTFESGDTFSAQWKIQGGSDDSDIALGRSIGTNLQTDKGRTPTFCPAVLRGVRDDASCINYGGNNRNALSLIPENLSRQADDGSLVFSDPLNHQQNDYVNTVLELRWLMGVADLVSITAYDNFGYGVALDLDGSRGEYGHRFSTSDIEVVSQELRLQSASGSTTSWMVGLSLSDEKFAERRDFNLRDNKLTGLGFGNLAYDQDTTAKSLYADISHPLSDNWIVSAALRYTDEQKTYRNGTFYIPPLSLYLLKNHSADYDLDKPWSGNLSLNFTPTDTLLMYAKVSQGFKSGGFPGGFPFNPAEVMPYREETILAWEAGFKQSWPEQSLSVEGAVFTYDYQDVQGYIRETNPTTGSQLDRLANQGDAQHDGIELNLDWQPVEQMSLKAGLGWLNAEFEGGGAFTKNIPGQTVPINGTRPYAPEWNGNVLGSYSQRLGASNHTLQWIMGYHYRSEFAGDQPSPVDVAVNKLPGYGVVDFSATLKRDTGPWDLTFWVRNLTDKTYRTRVKGDGLNSYVEFFGEPRSVGITALLRFNE